MKQPHTEETVRHTENEQNTGTHKKPGAPDAKGADRFGGGTRVRAGDVESSDKKIFLSSEGSISGRRLATPRWCRNLIGHPPLFSQQPTI